jgi:hypothetical protein
MKARHAAVVFDADKYVTAVRISQAYDGLCELRIRQSLQVALELDR